jgi:hypothetical protein
MGVGCPSEIMDEALTHSIQMRHQLEIGCQLKSQLKLINAVRRPTQIGREKPITIFSSEGGEEKSKFSGLPKHQAGSGTRTIKRIITVVKGRCCHK